MAECCDGKELPDDWLRRTETRCGECGGYGATRDDNSECVRCQPCEKKFPPPQCEK